MPRFGDHDFNIEQEWGSYSESGFPLTIRDPFTNKIRSVRSGELIHDDHIFPTKLIAALRGYDILTRQQRIAILNLQDNIQPLPASLNCSKGCELARKWRKFVKQDIEIHSEYRKSLAKKQEEIRNKILQMIETFTADNKGSLDRCPCAES